MLVRAVFLHAGDAKAVVHATVAGHQPFSHRACADLSARRSRLLQEQRAEVRQLAAVAIHQAHEIGGGEPDVDADEVTPERNQRLVCDAPGVPASCPCSSLDPLFLAKRVDCARSHSTPRSSRAAGIPPGCPP